jgi:phytol kinase
VSVDTKGLIGVYAYLFGILFLAEGIRRIKAWPSEFTRKCIHIGVGWWGFIAYWTIRSVWIVLIPPLSFVLINLLSYRWNIIPSMEIEDKRNLGTVYYPLSICILILLFWREGMRLLPVLGSMVMGLGDGMASIVGKKWGRHSFRFWRNPKTLEGSAAMGVFSALAAGLVLTFMTPLPAAAVVWRAVVVAGLSTAVEALSPWGLDNLSVPLGAAAAYRVLFM